MSFGLLAETHNKKETEREIRGELDDLMATARPQHSRRHSNSLVSEQERLARKREQNRIAQQVYRRAQKERIQALEAAVAKSSSSGGGPWTQFDDVPGDDLFFNDGPAGTPSLSSATPTTGLFQTSLEPSLNHSLSQSLGDGHVGGAGDVLGDYVQHGSHTTMSSFTFGHHGQESYEPASGPDLTFRSIQADEFSILDASPASDGAAAATKLTSTLTSTSTGRHQMDGLTMGAASQKKPGIPRPCAAAPESESRHSRRRALHIAASHGNTCMVKLLLGRARATGANPRTLDKSGRSVLFTAVATGCEAAVQIVLDAMGSEDLAEHSSNPGPGSCSDSSSGLTHTPKGVASDVGRAGIRAALNEPDAQGTLPLHLAVASGSASMVLLLLSNGADINGWRLPGVKYAALVRDQRKSMMRDRSSSSFEREENRLLDKENADVDGEEDGREPTVKARPSKRKYCLRPLFVLLCLAFLACGVLLGYVAHDGWHLWRGSSNNGAAGKTSANAAFGSGFDKFIYQENEFGERYCPDKDLTLRREWRKMSRIEKRQFVQAVKCLKHKPSKTRPTGSLFEDFAFVSGQIGMRTAGVASFFPWHRYLLWSFERELKNTCSYPGGIPFWDWTQDSDALAHSPLLNDLPGFGGDGNSQSRLANGSHGAYCVTDGNFANHMAAFDYIAGYGIAPSPHCVSRRFDPGDRDGRQVGALVSPSVISDIIALPDYASFSEAMQKESVGPVVAVPNWIQGDMAQYTAPNDVLYFLHLAQLDRIWWIWQHQVTAARLNDYSGRRRNDVDDLASIHDNLSLGTLLAPDVEVSDAMWGQWSFMCFTYFL
ncbi:tyrosinase central domain containing protein [Grosmannia clavigera kw1407]|uniref:Tyrosinase central domain containing protein n=1 Tax=Grosmannia clavigera (strain kw1407 / UAMH 11150) TaxID=655863 RepID=F0XF66_GROCL|nr:tyrosinase central domain containing protein [Grosmannia clavigera kw1407]EFX04623.1 tyrosinase central domain containing protein [Grosmannia clavigera kw1407]